MVQASAGNTPKAANTEAAIMSVTDWRNPTDGKSTRGDVTGSQKEIKVFFCFGEFSTFLVTPGLYKWGYGKGREDHCHPDP
jgi:hypothetical protein